MAFLHKQTITKIEIWPVFIPTTTPFVVATGRLDQTHNLFIRITLHSGTWGIGEIAPFPDITGEDVPSSFAVAKDLAGSLLGHPVSVFRKISDQLLEQAPAYPAARCGLETAVVDALCREAGLPLWALWGGADVRQRETDITIPICDLEQTLALAQHWHAQGFQIFKLKVGQHLEEDIHRIEALHQHFPKVRFILDANQGFQKDDVLRFMKCLHAFHDQIMLLEQPIHKDDPEGMVSLRQSLQVPIAADESVSTLEEARMVIRQGAADYINIKITKSGLIQGLDIAALARTSGIRLMIGGMLETRVAMGCSWSMVLGSGGFDILDLDTPLLLSKDPVSGGYEYSGPFLKPWDKPGLDMDSPATSDVHIIE
ncbi:MAG: dipeptide epimerase [Nitrospirae bacterium]|nr:dipeptide epimerase [Nitrospirota bacterium]